MSEKLKEIVNLMSSANHLETYIERRFALLTPVSLDEVRFLEHLISIEQMKQAHQEIMLHAASIGSHRENDYYFHGNYIHEKGLYITFSTETFQVLSVDQKHKDFSNYIPSGNDFQPIWEMRIFSADKKRIEDLLEELKITPTKI